MSKLKSRIITQIQDFRTLCVPGNVLRETKFQTQVLRDYVTLIYPR